MLKRLLAILVLPALLLGGCREETSTATVPAGPALARVTEAPTAAPAMTATSTVTPSLPAGDPLPTATPTETAAPATPTPPPAARGALVRVTMRSQVGVLLDEFPESMREPVADALLAQPAEAWQARAQRQARLTRLRLNFRDSHHPGKGPLPLPRPEAWSIALDEAGPSRQTVHGHDLVMIEYTLSTTILSDARSVGQSEPALAEVGGVWEETFAFPADPDLLLQRTGRGCINDRGFPDNSVDSENAWYFYDSNRTTCFEVLAARVGAVESTMRFHRLAWDAALADRVRSDGPTSETAADLLAVEEELAVNRVVYRYFTEGDCALEEGAVGASGWRRLLLFNATVHNVGGAALHIGRIETVDRAHNVLEFAPCHDHFHYQHYGDFTIQNEEQLLTSKQAFCVQSTDRWSNSEYSPLMHDYSCTFQGIQAGWVDEYMAGLDTQWMDITEVEAPEEGKQVQLGFSSNQDGFLCEGQPVLDEDGQPLWEPSEFTTEEGEPINRPRCDFIEGWDENNDAAHELSLSSTGSFVTEPCENGEIGPLRNCGFREVTIEGLDAACRVQQPVSLSLRAAGEDAPPQVVRVCERSAVLDTGVACTYGDAVANEIVDAGGATVSFLCPNVRDAAEAGPQPPDANYSLYAAPLWPADEAAPIEPAE
ncbi:MAG TPA: lysyl oxidase family protein [Candidatus Sulfomarinibacteraceae bacterium]|nr:lysyl oxidase family protein [Candidatus Sulfomarinibacteraceae bacterium]